MELHNIHKVESTIHGVKITLNNGVVLDISSNKNYFHLHFSGVKVPIYTSQAHYDQNQKVLETTNNLEIGYKHEDYRTGENS